MDDKQKVEIVINEIKQIYNLNDKYANLLKKNILNRAEIYKNVNYRSDDVSVIKNSSSITDFLLNRLINNIRNYEFDETYNRNNTDKGTYTAKTQSIYIANDKFLIDITSDKLTNRIVNPDSEVIEKAVEKVFNHEIGHALQVNFNGNNGCNNDKYQLLVSNLSNKYSSIFDDIHQFTDINIKQHGMIPTRINDKKKNIRDFYAPISLTTHLDEIFNDDEALQVTEANNKSQFKYDMGNGFYKQIYNYESSNYKITSYAKMMKIIMGEQRTFNSMYVDSIETYEFFDQFTNVSNEVFKDSKYEGKAPMLNILNALDVIRNNKQNLLVEANKLDLFFTNCLYMKINNQLNQKDISIEKIEVLEKDVINFQNQMMHNDNIVLKQEKYIDEIKKQLIQKKESLKDNINNNISQAIQHPRASELNALEKQKKIAKQNNDYVAYNNIQSSIEKIIRESRLEVASEKWDSMSIQDQISFLKIKINEAKILGDQDEFNYWNANLNSLNTKLVEQSEIKEYHQPTQNAVENDHMVVSQDLETKKDYNYYFDKMMESVQKYNPNELVTEEQKKRLIGEIFYNEISLIDSLSNEEEIRHVMDRSVNELSNNTMQIRLQNIIKVEIQEKYKRFHSEKNQEKIVNEESKLESYKNNSNSNSDLSGLISKLRSELNQIQNDYHFMMLDGYIDDEELATLIGMINRVINDGYSLKSLATDPSDLRVISVIINSLEEEQKKMNKMHNGIEEIGRTMK